MLYDIKINIRTTAEDELNAVAYAQGIERRIAEDWAGALVSMEVSVVPVIRSQKQAARTTHGEGE